MLLIAGKFLLRGNIMNRKMLVDYDEKRKELRAQPDVWGTPKISGNTVIGCELRLYSVLKVM
jgi:hypothetical protein